MMPVPQRHGECGFVVTEWVVGVVVVMVPVMLLMAVLPTWAARHEAAAAAAREATRTAVTLEDPGAARSAAVGAAHDVLRGRGIDPAGVRIEVGVPSASPGRLLRDGVVRATVALPAESVTIPLLGVIRGPVVGAAHARPLNPHRSRP